VKDDRLYLIHINECIQRIERYTASGLAAFQADTLIQDGVLRNLQTLTESTQRISESLKAAHPEVPWREIAQFRNVVVHDYLGIDLARVWDIVQHDLQSLKRSVTAMLEAPESE
jgi:uncharacterized protein with HEPN domain